MLSDEEYQLLIYENIKYVFENINIKDVIIVDNKFRSEFLGDPFPRDIILEYIKLICIKIDKNNFINENNMMYVLVVIYNLLIKYYIDVSVYNSDICKYYNLELKIFNDIEIKILELLDYNFNQIDLTKWNKKYLIL